MARFMNTFSWNEEKNSEFYSLVPAEQAMVGELTAQGKLLHLFLAEDGSGGWAVHEDESIERVLLVIEKLALRKFMTINVKQLAD